MTGVGGCGAAVVGRSGPEDVREWAGVEGEEPESGACGVEVSRAEDYGRWGDQAAIK